MFCLSYNQDEVATCSSTPTKWKLQLPIFILWLQHPLFKLLLEPEDKSPSLLHPTTLKHNKSKTIKPPCQKSFFEKQTCNLPLCLCQISSLYISFLFNLCSWSFSEQNPYYIVLFLCLPISFH